MPRFLPRLPRLLTELELNNAMDKMRNVANRDDYWENTHLDAVDILTHVLELMGYNELVKLYRNADKMVDVRFG